MFWEKCINIYIYIYIYFFNQNFVCSSVVRRVRRRRRPPSVLRPVRPSPSSVVVTNLQIHGRMHIFEKRQNMSPTATGLGSSDRARSGDFVNRQEIAVRVEKVGFTAETLLL